MELSEHLVAHFTWNSLKIRLLQAIVTISYYGCSSIMVLSKFFGYSLHMKLSQQLAAPDVCYCQDVWLLSSHVTFAAYGYVMLRLLNSRHSHGLELSLRLVSCFVLLGKS